MDESNKSLQEINKLLKEEKEILKRERDTLYVSQVAYLFEQAICSYVLPEVFEGDKHATISALLSYLHKDIKLPLDDSIESTELELLSEAEKRWNELCVGLNLPTISEGKGNFRWTYHDPSAPMVIRAISLLKENRRTAAHPKVSLKSAEEKLPSLANSTGVEGCMNQRQIDLIRKFIHFIQATITSGSEIYNKYFQHD